MKIPHGEAPIGFAKGPEKWIEEHITRGAGRWACLGGRRNAAIAWKKKEEGDESPGKLSANPTTWVNAPANLMASASKALWARRKREGLEVFVVVEKWERT